MEITQEKIVQDIEKIALSHKMVNSFGWGDPWEINKTDSNYKYPLVFLVDGESSLEGGQVKLAFSLLVLDVVTHDETNELKVVSDSLQTGLDIIGKLWGYDDRYIIDDTDITMRSFSESFKDNDAGYKFDIFLKVDERLNSCDAPFD